MAQERFWKAYTEECGNRARPPSAVDQVSEAIGVMQLMEEVECSAARTETRCIAFPCASVFRTEVTLATAGPGVLVVAKVSAQARLPVCTYLVVGACVTHVADAPLELGQDLQQILVEAAYPVGVTFLLPPPPMPPRGWARHIPRKKALQLTEEQSEFMMECWNKDPKVTAAVIRENLDKHFTGQEELQLLESEVQRFLDGVYRKVRKGEAGGAEGEEEEEEEEEENNRAEGEAACRGRGGGRGGSGRASRRGGGRGGGRS